MTTLAEIQAITKRIKAERDAAKQPVDKAQLEAQRNARVNTVFRTRFTGRRSV